MDNTQNQEQAVKCFKESGKARTIYLNALAGSVSIKEISEVWYKPIKLKDNSLTPSNALYQGKPAYKMQYLGMLEAAPKTSREELWKANLDFFVDLYAHLRTKEDEKAEKEFGIAPIDAEKHRQAIKEYLQSDFVKAILAPKNLKEMFGTIETLQNEYALLWGGFLFTYPNLIKKVYKKERLSFNKVAKPIIKLLHMQAYNSGFSVNILKYFQLIDKYKTLLLKTAIPQTSIALVGEDIFKFLLTKTSPRKRKDVLTS